MAPAEDFSASANTARRAQVSDEATEFLVQQFLDDWHYRVMHTSLAKVWDREQVMRSAMEILALNGVPLIKEEINNLAQLEESSIVYELVARIPNQVRENLERIAMQTRMLMGVATSIRKSVDDMDEEGIQVCFEENDSTSIGHEILKYAVIRASDEVGTQRRVQATWKDDAEKRCGRLTKCASQAEMVEHDLIAVQAQLSNFASEAIRKSKAVLMRMLGGQTKALQHGVFGAWHGLSVGGKDTRTLRMAYDKQLLECERALVAHKEKQIEHVKSILMKDARDKGDNLMSEVLRLWKGTTENNKLDAEAKAQMEALQGQLNGFKASAAENAKKVMSRVSGDADAMLVLNAFGAWKQFAEDYKKDKEFEDKVKASEQALKVHMEKKKSEAKQVLDKLSSGSDTALKTMCFSTWAKEAVEQVKTRKLEKEMADTDCRLKGFMSSHAQNAHGVSSRTIDQIQENLTLRVWNAWMTAAKVSHIQTKFQKQMDRKKDQLKKVHKFFQDLASQIEDGLGAVDETPRTPTRRWSVNQEKPGTGGADGGTTSGKMSRRNDGAVSLPDIHARPGVSAYPAQDPAPPPQPLPAPAAVPNNSGAYPSQPL